MSDTFSDYPGCEQCAFWERLDRNEDDGSCRRYPPVLATSRAPLPTLTGDHFVFPIVSSIGWCGEFVYAPGFRQVDGD